MTISSNGVFVLWIIVLVTITTQASSEAAEPTTRLYVFGDSLFDAGNGLYYYPQELSGKWPYGMSTGNKTLGRYSDGLIVPDYIAIFGNLNPVPPSLKLGETFNQGANFAFVDASVFDVTGEPMNLNQQISGFTRLKDELASEIGSMEARSVLKKSVFLFSFGGDVYFSYKSHYPITDTAQKIAYVNTVMDKITDALYNLYMEGARKFAFQNVMPLGCTPRHRVDDEQCEQQLTDFANIHNTALLKANKKLQIELPGFTYSILDYHTAIGDRIKSPATYRSEACYGKEERRAYGCGKDTYELCDNPNKYAFWDGEHISQNTSLQLATIFWSGGAEAVSGINLQKLFELSPDDTDQQT